MRQGRAACLSVRYRWTRDPYPELRRSCGPTGQEKRGSLEPRKLWSSQTGHRASLEGAPAGAPSSINQESAPGECPFDNRSY
jgi:hypothetical protein